MDGCRLAGGGEMAIAFRSPVFKVAVSVGILTLIHAAWLLVIPEKLSIKSLIKLLVSGVSQDFLVIYVLSLSRSHIA